MKAKTWHLLSIWYQPPIYEAVHREKEIIQKISFCRAEGVLKFSNKSHSPGDLGNLRVRSFQPEITDSTDHFLSRCHPKRDHNNLWFSYRMVAHLRITKEDNRRRCRQERTNERGMREADTISAIVLFPGVFFYHLFFLPLVEFFRTLFPSYQFHYFLS